jgi:hypothetical protein
MTRKHTFTAAIKPARGGGAYVEVPFDVEEAFGDKRPQVKATVEGEEFISRLMRMGTPCHVLGIHKELRMKLGKDYGDEIRVNVERDDTPREEIVVPPDLKVAFKSNKAAQDFFDKLSYTHRKEYVRWITEAKKEETRARRVVKAIEMMESGKRGI